MHSAATTGGTSRPGQITEAAACEREMRRASRLLANGGLNLDWEVAHVAFRSQEEITHFGKKDFVLRRRGSEEATGAPYSQEHAMDSYVTPAVDA